jgi:hypothetical protein
MRREQAKKGKRRAACGYATFSSTPTSSSSSVPTAVFYECFNTGFAKEGTEEENNDGSSKPEQESSRESQRIPSIPTFNKPNIR